MEAFWLINTPAFPVEIYLSTRSKIKRNYGKKESFPPPFSRRNIFMFTGSSVVLPRSRWIAAFKLFSFRTFWQKSNPKFAHARVVAYSWHYKWNILLAPFGEPIEYLYRGLFRGYWAWDCCGGPWRVMYIWNELGLRRVFLPHVRARACVCVLRECLCMCSDHVDVTEYHNVKRKIVTVIVNATRKINNNLWRYYVSKT